MGKQRGKRSFPVNAPKRPDAHFGVAALRCMACISTGMAMYNKLLVFDFDCPVWLDKP